MGLTKVRHRFVQGLPCDQDLKIEARTDSQEGSLKLNLKAGKQRVVSISMLPMTGSLVIGSSKSAVRVLLDGADKGEQDAESSYITRYCFHEFTAGARFCRFAGSTLPAVSRVSHPIAYRLSCCIHQDVIPVRERQHRRSFRMVYLDPVQSARRS